VSDGAEAASASPSDAAVADASAGRAAHALALILEREPRTLTELAQAVGATPVEAAALIDALERHELVAWADGRSGLRAGRRRCASRVPASVARTSPSWPSRASAGSPTRAGRRRT
jgi:hypothetical protein